MALAVGTRLGPYEIVGPLGAGGMGEVYRAKDTRLDRTVAIKILPIHLSANSDSKARFEREARAISKLTHPHICALHDVGSQDGIEFLVMEFLEGEALSQRLAKGALSTEQVLRHGVEIADALHKAHKEGIVHRDLKPGNIMMTKSGTKLLDFGLAKFEVSVTQQQGSGVSGLQTEQREITAEGTIVGTVQYMSPEQLEGKEADERTDIFALGSVLYEMATGQKAFTGKSHASLISAILKDDPPRVSQVQLTSPPSLDHVIKKCLEKDREERWQSAYDVASELRWIAESSTQDVVARKPIQSSKRFWLSAAICALLILAAIAIAQRYRKPSVSTGAQLVRFAIPPPVDSSFQGTIALSPDGTKLAFVVTDANGVPSLWVRNMNSLDAQRLPETEQATFPFWSPDSRTIAYFSRGKLRKINASGGTPQIICDSVDGRGGSWGSKGTILFAPQANSGLYRVSSEGGSAELHLSSGEGGGSLRWPYFLPDGNHFLYVYTIGDAETVGIYRGSLDSKDSRKLLPIVSRITYVSPGYVIYIDQNSLMCRRFDPDRLEFIGDPVPVAAQPWVDYYIFGASGFSTSDNGILAYRQGGKQLGQFTWYDRSGKKMGSVGPPSGGNEPAFSPDETRVVFYQSENTTGLDDEYILDLKSGSLSRFTFHPSDDNTAIWAPDGSRIVWSSIRNGWYELYQKLPSGAGSEEPLLIDHSVKYPSDFSPDGKLLLYDRYSSKSIDLWILPIAGDKKPFPYLESQSNEGHGRFSPDGNWIAYSSDESGKLEIYVQGFPATRGGKWQVSVTGGDQPQWSQDGRELVYAAPDGGIMSVDVVVSESGLSFGTPKVLFKTPLYLVGITGSRNDYLVTRDGQRFLINTPSEDTKKLPLAIILNWTSLLRAGHENP